MSLARHGWIAATVTATLLHLGGSPAAAQPADAAQASAPDKALRYHQVLQNRPDPGYLFDRFIGAYLESGTVAELETFLQDRASGGETADRLLLAFFYAHEGRDVEAIRVFRETLEDQPGSAAAWYHKAQAEARTLDFETALSDLDRAGQSQPDADLALKILKLKGQLLVRSGQREQARALWAMLLKLHPDDEHLHEDLVELQLEEGLFEQAAQTSRALIAKTADPYEKVLRELRLGDIHQRGGEKDAALVVYAGALDKVGAGSWLEQEIYAQIEQVFRREQDLSGLLAFYVTLAEDGEPSIGLQKRRAAVLSEKGDTDEALDLWRSILERTPGDRANREAYAQMLVDADRLDEAIEQVKRLVEQHPQDAELLLRLAELHHQAEDGDAAAATAQRFLAASDKSLSAHVRTARALERFGQTDAAEAVYRTMIEQAEQPAEAKQMLAEFLHRREREDEALAIWRGLAEQAQDPAELVRLARTLSSRGLVDEAYEQLMARADAFGQDVAFLGALTDAAWRTEHFDEAMPLARRRVALATDDTTLQQAIDQAARLAKRSEQVEAIITEMRAAPSLSLPETCLLAELLEASGDPVAADAALADAPADEPMIVMQQVRLHEARRDWSAAAAALQRLIELPGHRKSVHLRAIVDLLARDLRYEDALAWIQPWKELSPGSYSPWLVEANLLVKAGQDEKAIEQLRSATRQFDDVRELVIKLADLHTARGDAADAERYYWRLYEDARDLQEKLRWVGSLAQSAQAQGQSKRLIRHFEERRGESDQSLAAHLALAEIHRALGQYEERRQALLEAARVRPDSPELLLSVARIEMEQGDYDRALATLQRARQVEDTPRVRQQIIEAHMLRGDTDAAMALVGEVADQAQDADDLAALAQAFFATSEWAQGAAFLADRREAYPGDYRLAYLEAVALEEDLQTQQAIEAFLDVLAIDEEPPGQSTVAGPHRIPTWYIAEMERVLPREALDLVMLAQNQYQAYMHRHQQQLRYRPMMGGMGAAGMAVVQPPMDLTSAHGFAITHLRMLARQLDEAAVDTLTQRMAERGVTMPDLLLAVGENLNTLQAMPPDILEKYGEHPAVLGVMAMMGAHGQGQMTAQQQAAAIELFRDKRPELTLMVALASLAQPPLEAVEDEPAWDPAAEAMAALGRIDQPSFLTLAGLGQILQRQQAGMELPAELRDALVKQLIAWYPSVSTGGGQMAAYQQQWMFQIVASALQQADDPSALITFLEDEVGRAAASGAAQMPNPWAGQMNRGQPALRPIELPPSDLPQLPPHVAMLLQPGQMRFGPGMNVDVLALAERVGDVKDPVLRAALAAVTDQDEVLSQTITTMLEQDPPTLSAYLFAAGEAARDLEHAKAIALLSKARYLPMTSDRRQRIDGAIVAHVLELADAQGELREQGRQAALRLRRASADPAVRQELVMAMDQLGLTGEAEKLEKQMQQSAAIASVGPMHHVSVNGQAEQINQLMAEGKTEQATRLARQAVEQLAQGMLSPQMNVQTSSWERDRLIGVLQAQQLGDAIVAETDPGDSDSATRWARHGAVLEVLGRDDEALTAYQRALADRQDPAVLWRAGLLTSRTDKQAALKLLETIPPHVMQLIVQQAYNDLQQQSHEHPERVLPVIDLFAAWLGEMPEKDLQRISVPMLQPMLQLAAQMRAPGGRHLPHLYARDATIEEPQLEFAARRRAAHDALARAMLRVPGMADAGFTALLAAAEAAGGEAGEPVDPAAFEELAMAALTVPEPMLRQGMHYYYNSNQDQVRQRTPMAFLAARAAERDDRSVLAEVAASMRENRRSADADQLEAMADLYFVPAEEFVSAAEQYASKSRRAPGPRTPGQMPLDAIVAAWEQRELARTDIDLDPLVIDLVDHQLTQMGWSGRNAGIDYARLLAEQRDPQAARAFLEQLMEKCLGPAEKRAELIQRQVNQSGYTHGTVQAKIHGLGQLLGEAAQDRRLIVAVLELARPYAGSPASPYNQIEQGLRDVLREAGKAEDLQQVVTFLQSTPFLGDPATFRSYPASGLNDARTAMEAFTRGMRYSDSRPIRDPLKAWLKDEAPATLGTALLRALVEEEKPLFVEAIDRYASDIAAMDTSGRVEVAAVLPADLRPEDARTPAAREVLTQLLGDTARKARERTDAFLAARHFQRMPFQIHEMDDQLGSMVGDLAAAGETQRIIEVLKHANTLREQAERTGQYHWSSHQSFASNVLERTLREHRNLATIDVINQLMRDPELNLEYEDDYDYRMREVFSDIRESQKDADGKNPGEVERVRRMLTHLAQRLAPGPAVALIKPLHEDLDRLSDDQITELLPWLVEQRQLQPEAGILLAAELALRLERTDSGTYRDEDATEVIFLIEPVLKDAALPVGLRLAGAVQVLRDLPKDWRAMLAVPAARVLLAAQSDETFFLVHDQARTVLEAMEQTERDSTWRELAGQLITGYVDRHQRDRQNRLRFYGPSAWSFGQGRPSRPVSLLMLDFALAVDDTDAARRLVHLRDGILGRTTPAWAILARHGEAELVNELVRRYHPEAYVSMVRDLEYDAQLHAEVPAVVSAINEPDLAYLAQAGLAATPGPDEKANPDGQLPSREQRMTDLASRFASIDFQTDVRKRQALLMLITEEPALDLLRQPLAEAAEGVEYAALALAQHGDTRSVQQVVLAHLVAELRAGQTEPFARTVGRLSAASTSNDQWRAREAFSTLARVLQTAVGDRLAHLDPQELVALRDVVHEMVQPATQQHMNYDQQFSGFHVLLFAMTDSLDTYTAWRNEHGEKLSNHNVRLDEYGLRQALQRLTEAKPALPIEKRLELAQRMLQAPGFAAAFRRDQELMNAIDNSNLLSDDEMLEHRAVLASDRASWERIAELARRKKQMDVAADAYRQAVLAADDAKQQAQVLQTMMRRGMRDAVAGMLQELPDDPAFAKLREETAGH